MRYKKQKQQIKDQQEKIFALEMKNIIESQQKNFIVKSDEENPTLYFSMFDKYAEEIKKQGKSVVFVGCGFYFA